jgi:hypothetical protein
MWILRDRIAHTSYVHLRRRPWQSSRSPLYWDQLVVIDSKPGFPQAQLPTVSCSYARRIGQEASVFFLTGWRCEDLIARIVARYEGLLAMENWGINASSIVVAIELQRSQ